MIKSMPNVLSVNVKLDDTAILKKAREAAEMNLNLQDKRDQLKEVCTDLREDIKNLETSIKRLMSEIQTKTEFKPNAQVIERFDSETKTVTIEWNGQQVGQRKMTENEYNTHFNSVFTND